MNGKEEPPACEGCGSALDLLGEISKPGDPGNGKSLYQCPKCGKRFTPRGKP